MCRLGRLMEKQMISDRLRKNSQAEAAKVFVEREAWNMIEQRGHHSERDRIAERQSMLAGIGAEYPFGFLPHRISVGDEVKLGLYLAEKSQRSLCGVPIAKQRHRFTEDIPGRTPGGPGRSRFRRQAAGLSRG
jgi:hypothetical protein